MPAHRGGRTGCRSVTEKYGQGGKAGQYSPSALPLLFLNINPCLKPCVLVGF